MSETLIEAPSAALQEWRQVRIDIFPSAHAIRWSVFLRKHRGTDLLWQRALGHQGLEMTPERSVESTEGILRTVAAALLETADDLAQASR